MYQITAKNRKGDFLVETVKDGKQADIRQRQLYHEIDDNGDYRWGTIIATNLSYVEDGGGVLEDTVRRGSGVAA